MQFGMNARIEDYSAKKAKGAASLVKVGGDVFIVSKKYDPDTGAALPDDTRKIDVDALDAEIAKLESELAARKALKGDIEKL